MKTLEDLDLQIRKELVSRVVASSAICKSARLRDLFLYLCNRVLDESVDDIHELELGHNVFGRAEHYDTASDNIVRVHASLLRKRLAEHFQTEGINEPIVIEIPRGNYAPIFKKRDPLLKVVEIPEPREPLVLQPNLTSLVPEESHGQQVVSDASYPPQREKPAWKLWGLGSVALAFLALSAFLLIRSPDQRSPESQRSLAKGTAVRRFWLGIFQPNASVQVVLDDASLDFYQEATGHPIALAEYFDRSYLLPVEQAASAAHLDPKLVHSFLLKRQSNYADVNLVSRLTRTAGLLGSSANAEFARDFSFRQLKSGNMILLGTRQSNPWIQQFDSYLALRWKFDPELSSYYPVDTTAGPSEQDKFRSSSDGSKTHEGYASVAFLPNPGGTGNVLIISGTGGAAVSAGLEFLNDEPSMSQLSSRLNSKDKNVFPYFEVLLKAEQGGGLARNVTIVKARSPQPVASHDAAFPK